MGRKVERPSVLAIGIEHSHRIESGHSTRRCGQVAPCHGLEPVDRASAVRACGDSGREDCGPGIIEPWAPSIDQRCELVGPVGTVKDLSERHRRIDCIRSPAADDVAQPADRSVAAREAMIDDRPQQLHFRTLRT